MIDLTPLAQAETAIREAMETVESMGSDTRLTDAVTLLGRAKDSVADFVDSVPRRNEAYLYPQAMFDRLTEAQDDRARLVGERDEALRLAANRAESVRVTAEINEQVRARATKAEAERDGLRVALQNLTDDQFVFIQSEGLYRCEVCQEMNDAIGDIGHSADCSVPAARAILRASGGGAL